MNLVLLILFLFSSSFDGPERHTVMAISGLNLRAEPDKTSKVLKALKFGSVVYSEAYIFDETRLDIWYKKDTIDGVIGHWIDAESKEFNLKGYLFSPYVYFGDIVDNQIDENEIRITYEGLSSSEFNYHPDLKWYGIYKENNTFRIEKIELELQLTKVKFDSTYLEFISPNDEGLILKTNKMQVSDYIIGSTKDIFEEGMLETLYQSNDLGYSYTCDAGFLYPAMKKQFHFKKRRYILHGLENIQVDSSTQNLERQYDIQYQIWDKNKLKYSKSIRNELNLCCDAEKHAHFQTPKVYWVGDFNKDEILDCIIYQHTMTATCGVCWSYSLFLSEKSQNNITLKYIDTAISCN